MKTSLKYIVDQDQPTHVVLPISDYEALVKRLERAQVGDIRPQGIGPTEETLPIEVVQRIIDGDPPVKVWREYRDLSVEQLATAAEVSVTHIHEMESSCSVENTEVAKAVASVLDVDPGLLI